MSVTSCVCYRAGFLNLWIADLLGLISLCWWSWWGGGVQGAVLCVGRRSAASLVSTHSMAITPFPSQDNQKCLQTMSNVPWRQNHHPPLRTTVRVSTPSKCPALDSQSAMHRVMSIKCSESSTASKTFLNFSNQNFPNSCDHRTCIFFSFSFFF